MKLATAVLQFCRADDPNVSSRAYHAMRHLAYKALGKIPPDPFNPYTVESVQYDIDKGRK